MPERELDALLRDANRKAGTERARLVATEPLPRPPGPEDDEFLLEPGRARPTLRSKPAEKGERITRSFDEEQKLRYYLEGRQLGVGDVVELFTTAANGWVRGRFEWTEQEADVPRFAVNLWDPNGVEDEDGLPPWVGSLEAAIPPRAVFRWPEP
jgi:hypothetical protein